VAMTIQLGGISGGSRIGPVQEPTPTRDRYMTIDVVHL
jgi:hypothetical protein